MVLEIGKTYQFKGTRYNGFLNGRNGLCQAEAFGKRKRRHYRTRVVRIQLEFPKESGKFCVPVNCEENDVEFAEIGSEKFETFHHSLVPAEVRKQNPFKK